MELRELTLSWHGADRRRQEFRKAYWWFTGRAMPPTAFDRGQPYGLLDMPSQADLLGGFALDRYPHIGFVDDLGPEARRAWAAALHGRRPVILDWLWIDPRVGRGRRHWEFWRRALGLAGGQGVMPAAVLLRVVTDDEALVARYRRMLRPQLVAAVAGADGRAFVFLLRARGTLSSVVAWDLVRGHR